jgi:catechol 2,3-dioxygenase-like lactoylglutathione lyase family enzyme
MLHHISLAVSDIVRSDAFYHAALGALGYVMVWQEFQSFGVWQVIFRNPGLIRILRHTFLMTIF